MKVNEKQGIVLEGGGGAGQAYLGLAKYFNEIQEIPKYICGVSVGSIFGLLLALQYSYKELLQLTDEQPDFFDVRSDEKFLFKDLNDSLVIHFISSFWICKLPFIGKLIKWVIFRLLTFSKTYRSLFCLRNYGGFFQGREFETWLLKLIQRRFPNIKYPTFRDLETYYGVNLYICATDIDSPDPELMCLNAFSTPDIPLHKAVRMSISLPMIFEPPRWEYGLYTGRDKTGHRIVDGGVMSNSPMWVFLHDHPNIVGQLPDDLKVTCFVLDETKSVKGFDELNGEEETLFDRLLEKSKIFQLIEKTYSACLASDNILLYRHNDLVCRIPRKNYSTLQFSLPPKKKELLINSAYVVVKDYFNRPD